MKAGEGILLPRVVGQMVRYGLLGVAINLAFYAVYLAITALALSPFAAATLCFVLAVPVSLAIHRRLTFRSSQISGTRRALFALAYAMGYVLHIGNLYLLYRVAGLPHQFAQFVSMVLVALFLFCFQKFLVFKT